MQRWAYNNFLDKWCRQWLGGGSKCFLLPGGGVQKIIEKHCSMPTTSMSHPTKQRCISRMCAEPLPLNPPTHSSNRFIKFTDDTTVMGLIGNSETELQEVRHLALHRVQQQQIPGYTCHRRPLLVCQLHGTDQKSKPFYRSTIKSRKTSRTNE